MPKSGLEAEGPWPPFRLGNIWQLSAHWHERENRMPRTQGEGEPMRMRRQRRINDGGLNSESTPSGQAKWRTFGCPCGAGYVWLCAAPVHAIYPCGPLFGTCAN